MGYFLLGSLIKSPTPASSSEPSILYRNTFVPIALAVKSQTVPGETHTENTSSVSIQGSSFLNSVAPAALFPQNNMHINSNSCLCVFLGSVPDSPLGDKRLGGGSSAWRAGVRLGYSNGHCRYPVHIFSIHPEVTCGQFSYISWLLLFVCLRASGYKCVVCPQIGQTESVGKLLPQNNSQQKSTYWWLIPLFPHLLMIQVWGTFFTDSQRFPRRTEDSAIFTRKGPMPPRIVQKLLLPKMLTFILSALSFSISDFLSLFLSALICQYTFPKKQENSLT